MDILVDNKIEKREYQEMLYERCHDESSLVVLPTGTGKTIVSLLITCDRLEDGGKSLFLAPTKPLVEQQCHFYSENMEVDENYIEVFTGDVSPDDRKELWKDAKVIFATPQVVENDLLDSSIDLTDVKHVTFDECHRTTGSYPYEFIADIYYEEADSPLVTGLSASPASNEEDIVEVCNKLGITNVEVITEDMECLSKYTHETEIEELWVDIDDEILEVKNLLEDYQQDVKKKLKSSGVLSSARKSMPLGELLNARNNLSSEMSKKNTDSSVYKNMSRVTEAIKLEHALETVETQGLKPFLSFYEDLEKEAKGPDSSKATERMVKDRRMEKSVEIARGYDTIHPKLKKVRSSVALTKEMGGQSIVFTERRETVNRIVEHLNKGPKITAHRFVGQSESKGKSGMSQDKQKEVLSRFREEEFDVLVATSVAEEGLDIPQVDLVLFYEPIASEIRAIQRKGRTGRESEGSVKVLIGEKTRDKNYYYASLNKEDKMKNALTNLRDKKRDIMDEIKNEQSQLEEFEESVDEEGTVNIIVDQRETSSSVVRNLSKEAETEVKTLDIGDYIISEDTVIERKSVEDFLDTLVGNDRSLFEQATDMADSFLNIIFIIEGNQEELYSRNIHPNAVRGALSTLSLDFGASVMFTSDEDDTAGLIKSMASREQEDKGSEFSEHGSKDARTLTEHQVYVVSSIYDVGPVKSKKLLREFGTIRNIINADIEELKSVEGIGKETAENMLEIFTEEYSS